MNAVTRTDRWTRRPEGSNWGDFGPDDQLGRLNLITPERRLAAIKEVKEGLAFALSLPLDFPGGEPEDYARRGPKLFASEAHGQALYNMQITASDITSDDGVHMSLQYSTQWDSLAHWGRLFDLDGSGAPKPCYYNGFRPDEHVVGPKDGHGPHADKLGVENMAMTGMQGRGVMVDLGRAYGTTRARIGYDQLMRAIETQKVEVRTGDMLLLYTGYGDALLAANKRPDPEAMHRVGVGLDGSDARLLDWIDESGVVALISDNEAVEAFELDFDKVGEEGLLPLHDRCLFRLGVYLGELWWLGDLARHLEKVGRHAFLLTAPPLRLPGAVGSPATPVATV